MVARSLFLPLTGLFIVGLLLSPSEGKDKDLTSDVAVQGLSKANQEFSFNLYKKLVKPRENMIMSGFSVATVLAMLLQGTRGLTEKVLLTTLGYDKMAPGLVEDAYKKVLEQVRGNKEYQLEISNSIWVRDTVLIRDEFQRRVSQTFRTEAMKLKSRTAMEDINKYVARKTGNLIKNFMKEKPGDNTVMILMNALFFKGTWQTKFDNRTFPAGFIDNDDEVPHDAGSAVTTMMRVKDQFPFVESNELKAEIVELPYKGGEASMVILLPSQGTTLVEMEHHMTSEKLRSAMKELKPTKMSLIMPKFKVESELDLQEPLAHMGLGEIFTAKANFTGIGSHLQVTEIFQKAVIDVTPEGSKAAAVTSGTLTRLRPAFPERYRVMRIVHPFFFVLRHKPTDAILFMGRYSKSAPFNDKA